ncbi:MAG: hypothetical protein H0X38_16850 [Planctomycetes bacterium]|nr:hypothetical protein [Planctomycetota bacterium]
MSLSALFERLRLPAAALLLGALAMPVAPAIQLQDLNLVSPVNAQTFPAVGTPPNQTGGDTLSDMGTDDDGCRMSSGACEYDFYIATCPYSYFSAMIVEWDDRTGRFRGDLTPEFKAWVDKEFNTERQIDTNDRFDSLVRNNKARGLPPPDRRSYVMTQNDIPLEKRYRLALSCYQKRGARPTVLAKLALTGAWALRARMNLSVTLQSLAGGYEEVNDKITRKIKEGENFSLAKWLPIYRDIFVDSKLSDEGYLVAGMAYFGFALRDGNALVCRKILDKLAERFKDTKDGEVLRGLVRERAARFTDYLKFESSAAASFMEAIANEEFSRRHLPEIMLAVAESLRRNGDEARAMDWYLALAKMDETQPADRDAMRAQGGAPSPDAPYTMQLGWIADRHVAALTKQGLVHPGVVSGADKRLLDALVFEHLGSSDYHSPSWKPTTGATKRECEFLLSFIGKATVDFAFRNNTWPKTFGELWEHDVIRDRNYVNRFCCPVTGKPFLYKQLDGDVSHIAPKTVVIATADPVDTNQGKRFGGFLANDTVIWSATPLVPGELAHP